MKFEAKGWAHAPMTDPGRGKHLWNVIAMYRVTDPTLANDPSGQILLDMENLLTIEGPGCFKCEQPWVPGLERRFCQGVM